MRWLPFLFLAALLAGSRPAAASCGCESCPLDAGSQWHEAQFSIELTQQYIDQNHLRIGTEDAVVGQIPSTDDEVRTINRATAAGLTYRPAPGWSFSATLPWVSHTHAHIHHEDPATSVLERWSYTGLGDMQVLATRFFTPGGRAAPRCFVRLGGKAPTGRTQVPAVDGDQPEPASRPGTGSWDLLAGVGAEWRVAAPGGGEAGRTLPIRVSVSGRVNGKGTEDYRVGSELQAHLGTEYPVAGPLSLQLQGNFRARAKDDVGLSVEDNPGNTGSTVVFVSPGLSVQVLPATTIYGLFQVPVYQRVNGIQLVARSNLYVGLTRSLL
jgi:hypothetical protein